MTPAVRNAVDRGREAARAGWRNAGPPPAGGPPERFVAIGDPQTTFERFLAILDREGLLGNDGFLRPGVSLTSMGDHFDFPGDPGQVGEEGFRILSWLAAHPAASVILLAGNHDLCRVMELAGVSDRDYAEAREHARRIRSLEQAAPGEAAIAEETERFVRRFPDLPSPSVVRRDYASFTVRQRELVQDLLLGARLKLAQAATTGDGRPVLLTHAGVTSEDLDHLGAPLERDPARLAARLNGLLREAVGRVGAAWRSGASTMPLDLSPIHTPGRGGREGGGLLYHRPADPSLPSSRPRSDEGALAPRRYDPRHLPAGLLQVAGHTGHRSCLRDLGDWIAPSARAFDRGGLRTLATDGTAVVYEAGIRPVDPAGAGVYLIDGEMNRVPVESYPLLDLGGWIS